MAFIIIETKENIQNNKNIILDILSKSLSMRLVEETNNTLIIQTDSVDKVDKEVFLGIASEIYADLRVYISSETPRFNLQTIETWFKMIPFNQTVVYTDQTILLKRIEFPINNELKKIVLKTVYEDNDLLHTIKIYLENNQNTSQASKVLYLHRNTLIQRLDKFYSRTGLDCRSFIDAFIVYAIIK
ncbi:helix-turn-helix domain-containing protein [Acholeplasma granularum]|uniref:helix-turn-helix domain-containing protein n=1 Tax=Acholeplasma granularum TaxID=264635 RepID=UPI00138AB1B1|nr:helix-turn-helix domain-containing protein [Acholeplasma granularum]